MVPFNSAISTNCLVENQLNGILFLNLFILGFDCENLSYSLIRFASTDYNARVTANYPVTLTNRAKDFTNNINMLKEYNFDEKGKPLGTRLQ